jgi:hypothetical protein
MEEYVEIIEDEQEEQIDIFENVVNEVDPTVPEHVKNITKEDIKKWNSAKNEVTANDVTFEDGTTFQEKYDSGELKGEPGKDGVDGKTPVKGEDYFTTTDKQELVDLVLAEIPSAEGVGY